MSNSFAKTVEDFVCEICGTKVKGTGYTDHCPNCLTSKHVDINPGDRMAKCGGLMEPIGLIKKKGKFQIKYRCQKCNYEKFNQAAPEDNQNKITQLSQTPT